MLLVSGLTIAIVVVAGLTAVVVGWVLLAKQKARRLAPWKMVRNGMNPEEVKAILGSPRNVIPLDGGESWDYGAKPYEATVTFTDGRVTGYIKPF